jgi:hypothetical protein
MYSTVGTKSSICPVKSNAACTSLSFSPNALC